MGVVCCSSYGYIAMVVVLVVVVVVLLLAFFGLLQTYDDVIRNFGRDSYYYTKYNTKQRSIAMNVKWVPEHDVTDRIFATKDCQPTTTTKIERRSTTTDRASRYSVLTSRSRLSLCLSLSLQVGASFFRQEFVQIC